MRAGMQRNLGALGAVGANHNQAPGELAAGRLGGRGGLGGALGRGAVVKSGRLSGLRFGRKLGDRATASPAELEIAGNKRATMGAVDHLRHLGLDRKSVV